jgi:hypothetical protein
MGPNMGGGKPGGGMGMGKPGGGDKDAGKADAGANKKEDKPVESTSDKPK